jgi:two-component system, OmpR family, sensor histidine kinase BaeS
MGWDINLMKKPIPNEPSSLSINTIRRRLILILLRAFLIVVGITIIGIIGTTVYELSSNTGQNPFYKSPNATILEAYYLGHGSWEGIDSLIRAGDSPDSRLLRLEWEQAILLDKDGNVVLYYGKGGPMMGMFNADKLMNAQVFELKANGEVIGTLLVDSTSMPHPVRLSFSVINPVLAVSVLMLLLTAIIGFLLMRRMVNPLSEVIAAAESVAKGNLKTRISTKHSQSDLAALSTHFNRMTETLERNDTERRALLADIAHELRTPLSVLRGRLEGIVDGVYPANDANIAQALEETYLLERLVEDLRLLTMAESRQLHFELKETNIIELLRKIVSLFLPQATGKHINLVLSNSDETINLMIDPQRLEQVIGNLIGNSLRYVPSGGTIMLDAKSIDGKIEIKVSDTGPGVPEEELPFVFDRFWRGEKSRARVSGGVGLGLAICKNLVEAQGGSISARNLLEGGLEVTVSFPPSD